MFNIVAASLMSVRVVGDNLGTALIIQESTRGEEIMKSPPLVPTDRGFSPQLLTQEAAVPNSMPQPVIRVFESSFDESIHDIVDGMTNKIYVHLIYTILCKENYKNKRVFFDANCMVL